MYTEGYDPKQQLYAQGQPYQPPPAHPYQQQPPPQTEYAYAQQPASPYGAPQQPYAQSYGAPQYGAPQYNDGVLHGGPESYGAPPVQPVQQMDDGKFADASGYRDILFLVLFVVHLIAVFIVLIAGGTSRPADNSGENLIPFYELSRVMTVCIIGAIVAMLYAAVYIVIIRKYAEKLIIFTLIGAVVFSVVLAIISFASGVIVMGIVFLFVAALQGLFYYFWRSRIPFATALLKTVANLLQRYPAPTYFAYASLLVQVCWLLLWVPTFAISQHYTGGAGGFVTFFLILSFYWTGQVIKNVVHVTTSGLIATWYFLSGVGMPKDPTSKAFKRAMTTSFGSICLGSLLVALLQTIRYFLRSMRRGNNWIVCIVDCLLGIIENLINYFNMYAFTQVAIYGKTYCQAAKDTWTLVKSRGVDAIVNDNLISGVLVMGAIVGGVVCAVVGGLIGLALIPAYFAALAVVCFFIGMSLVMLSMEVVESGVATIFVCFAMEPRVLESNSPELFRLFTETYHGLNV